MFNLNKLLSAFLLLFVIYGSSVAQKKVTLENLHLEGIFGQKSVSGLRSTNDGEHYTTLKDNKIVKSEYKTGKEIATILDCNKISLEGVEDYEFSADETKVLLLTARENIYRRSFTANYYIYDLKSKKLRKLSLNGRQQLATFSPNGKKIAFVRENNLFIVDLESGNEKQITADGKYNHIINGAPDWVYEEEFEFNKAFEWSPDSKHLAYIKFNEKNVRMFSMPMYAGTYPTHKQNSLYPGIYTFKYPKAGEDNSIVSVHTYNLENNKTNKMDIGRETDIYIPRLRWTQNPEKLSIFRLNRLQNKLEILFANPANGSTKVIYTEKNKYYIDEGLFDNLQYLDDKKHFILTSEADGYVHIYLYDLSGKLVRQITKGNWDVTEFIGYDSKKKLFYYQAAEESPMRRNIYSINIKGKKKKKLTTKIGTNEAIFSKNYKYFINYFSNVKTPTEVTLHDYKGKQIRVLEDNKDLKNLVKNYKISYKEFFTFKTSGGDVLNGWMIKPLNFDENKKYPVLMTQYSGPNSQEVLDEWAIGWEQYLAEEGYIVACVDGRGTGARGEEFRKLTYLNLGKYETIDQIEAGKYLGRQKYIDEARIGIWGWSFGGFMSILCMTKGNDVFKAGIAVAPVTNWRYYDNVYTERFMRTPAENPKGYDENSPMNFVDKLKGKLLICHGTADDNVHIQNTYEIAERFIQANKDFEMFAYPNRNHGIYGGYTRLHLFRKMANFVKENL